MYVGLLTAPFGDKSLEEVIQWAGENGFAALEVNAGPGSPHLDPGNFKPARARQIKKLLQEQNVKISSLACYRNLLDPDPAARKKLGKDFIEVLNDAALLGVDVVCTMAGMPLPGKSRMQTIIEEVPQVYPAILEHAASKGVKIALENWTATNIQHLAHWDKIFEVVPNENFGLNFDPSHLFWQGIDYLWAVERFGKRIFHTHAKDTEVRADQVRYIGNQDHGWWRYVIPGLGGIDWGQYIGALRRVGYNGVLSIEHEDGAVGREEGFLIGKKYLSQFMA
jgi:sugar phosphate isomerase/epimerase